MMSREKMEREQPKRTQKREKSDFALRLIELRREKGVTARDMSLALGQSPGYISNVENGVSLPSMAMFFSICEYFGIQPYDFFRRDAPSPAKANALAELCETLTATQIDHLTALLRDLKQ